MKTFYSQSILADIPKIKRPHRNMSSLGEGGRSYSWRMCLEHPIAEENYYLPTSRSYRMIHRPGIVLDRNGSDQNVSRTESINESYDITWRCYRGNYSQMNNNSCVCLVDLYENLKKVHDRYGVDDLKTLQLCGCAVVTWSMEVATVLQRVNYFRLIINCDNCGRNFYLRI